MSPQIVSDAERTSTPMTTSGDQRALYLAGALLLSGASAGLAFEGMPAQSTTSAQQGFVPTHAAPFAASPTAVAHLRAPATSDDFTLLLQNIANGALPTMSGDRQALAEAAADSNARRADENVDEWARRLAEATANAND